jgi:hypothetical protein
MAELHHRLSSCNKILASFKQQFDPHNRHGWCINSWKAAAIWLLILVLAMAAASMSWAVAAPTAWLASSNNKQQAEGLRSLLLPTGVRTSTTGGLKCRAQPMCVAASFDEAAAFGKSNGFVDMGALPIQFENGQDPPTVVFAPNRRIVAIGDLHGDLERTQSALQLAGVLSTDGEHRWVGGTTVLVQVGDVLDRGEDEIAILSLLAWLGKQARSKGGAVFQILGNHETMNVAGDFRYVAPGGFHEAELFAEYCEQDHGGNWDAAFEAWHEASQELKRTREAGFTSWLPMFNPIKIQKGIVARTKLLSPGGPLAMQLASHGVVLKVNDWLFAHGGVLPHHVDYGLERMNREVSLWMKMGNNRWGKPAEMPFVAVKGFDSIVWSRLYSKENFDRPQEKIQACGILAAALSATNSRGLIVGHTPQTVGANCKCDGRIWRIDVGMSSGVLHALPEVLEIVDDKVRIMTVTEEFLPGDSEEFSQEESSSWKGKLEVQKS